MDDIGSIVALIFFAAIAVAVVLWNEDRKRRRYALAKLERERAEQLALLEKDREKRAQILRASHHLVEMAELDLRSLVNSDKYIGFSEVDEWKVSNKRVVDLLSIQRHDLVPNVDYHPFLDEISGWESVDSFFANRNDKWVQNELSNMCEWFNNAGPSPLSQAQREAIVRDEDKQLVVAGAGTGKTTTIIFKVKYLLEKNLANPEDILTIAYARKAKEELDARLSVLAELSMDAKTFHSLGLSIIASQGEVPDISSLASDDLQAEQVIDEILDSMLQDPSHHQDIVSFFLFYPRHEPVIGDYSNLNDYLNSLRASRLGTIKGERVKSFEELQIANWLFLNGISYTYERKYEIRTATRFRRQYKPDFYLDDYGIYLEHFGIGRNGETAPWVNSNEYREQMAWKRQLHSDNGTDLVETFSYQRRDNTLFPSLKEQLLKKGVVFKPISTAELAAAIKSAGEAKYAAGLIGRFLALFKAAGFG